MSLLHIREPYFFAKNCQKHKKWTSELIVWLYDKSRKKKHALYNFWRIVLKLDSDIKNAGVHKPEVQSLANPAVVLQRVEEFCSIYYYM